MKTVETLIGNSIQICGIIWAAMFAILLLLFLLKEVSNYIVQKERGFDKLLKVLTNIGGYGFYGMIGLACLYAIIFGIISVIK